MNRQLFLKILAAILVLVYAFGGDLPFVNVGWLGLFFFIASFI